MNFFTVMSKEDKIKDGTYYLNPMGIYRIPKHTLSLNSNMNTTLLLHNLKRSDSMKRLQHCQECHKLYNHRWGNILWRMQAFYHLWSYSTWSVGESLSHFKDECFNFNTLVAWCARSFSTNVKTSFSAPATTIFWRMSQYPNPTCTFSFKGRLSDTKFLPIT